MNKYFQEMFFYSEICFKFGYSCFVILYKVVNFGLAALQMGGFLNIVFV